MQHGIHEHWEKEKDSSNKYDSLKGYMESNVHCVLIFPLDKFCKHCTT